MLSLEQRGSGSAAAIFIHGAGGTRLQWVPVMEKLAAAGIASLAIDLPGHGNSEGEALASVDQYAARVADTLRELNRPAVICGHSMGGAIALTLALDYPSLVRGLVLVSTSARLKVSSMMFDALRDATARDVSKMIIRSTTEIDPDEYMKLQERWGVPEPKVYYRDFQACDAFDRREEVATITCPVLIVCGTKDKMTPVKFSRWLAGQIPGARLVEFENAGHMLMVEQPGRLSEELTQFLQKYQV